MKINEYKVLGLMSGTSLDGIDIAYCKFNFKENKWAYKIEHSNTIKYTSEWLDKLKNIHKFSSLDFILTHNEYGNYLGQIVKSFINNYNIKVDFVASHGHTIFHQTDKKITFQIGSGAEISSVCGLPVVCDFRSLDVALGGQGAPLVPIGDKLLFQDFNYCLNLGGIANISFENKNQRIAFDICPVNIILNNCNRNK